MNIFVGCSSSNDFSKKYLYDCNILLEELLKDNDLVFGACNSWLMGLAYDITKKEIY